MKSISQILRLGGGVLALLSLTMLMQRGFQLGTIELLRIVLEWYDGLLHVLFGWAEPPIRHGLALLGTVFHMHLKLYPHWKHIFVLVWLYCSAFLRGNWEDGLALHEEGATTFGIVMWSMLLALAAGLGGGTVPLGGGANSWNANMIVATVTIATAPLFWLGFVAILYFQGRDTNEFAKMFGILVLPPAALGALLLLAAPHFATLLLTVPNWGLALILAFVLARCILDFAIGAIISSIDSSPWYDVSWASVRDDPIFRTGAVVLTTMAGAGVLVATSAGLHLAGL